MKRRKKIKRYLVQFEGHNLAIFAPAFCTDQEGEGKKFKTEVIHLQPGIYIFYQHSRNAVQKNIEWMRPRLRWVDGKWMALDFRAGIIKSVLLSYTDPDSVPRVSFEPAPKSLTLPRT